MAKARKRINPRKTPTPKTPRPRRPTDLTLRNLRALHTAHASLGQKVEDLAARVATLEAYVDHHMTPEPPAAEPPTL